MIIFETIIPVFLLIILGKVFKSKGILSDEGISCIKSLSTNVFLPVMAFDTLIHGSFSSESIIFILIEIFILFAAYFFGFILKRFFNPEINNYVPYAMTTYEGGLFGWALIAILVGQKSKTMFTIISMDIFSGIFCFTILSTGLKMLAGQTLSKKEIIKSIVTSPMIIAVFLGFIGAAFNLGEIIDNSIYASFYSKITNLFIQPLSSLILISIGSGLVFNKEIFKKSLKLATFRYLIQIVLCIIALLIIYKFSDLSYSLLTALLMYFLLPTSFLLSMYTTNEETVKFTSGFLSLQIIISLIIFCIISLINYFVL